MAKRRLHKEAWVALALTGLYYAAEALCQIWVSVYFWVNSLDFSVICRHYMAQYLVTPVVFILAGWYSQARDRAHVYRIGLVLHAAFYATLLILQEKSVDYAVPLGALMGVTWGMFWPGAQTFNYDVTVAGEREYYYGLLQVVTGTVRLVAPLVGALIIASAADKLVGYHVVFGVALVLYGGALVLSFKVPRDSTPRPFRFRRAIFPGKEQRDWRLILLASGTLGGAYHVFAFLLGLIMYMQTEEEWSVGAFASFQAIVGIGMAYVLARTIRPGRRRKVMFWGTMVAMAAGMMVSWKLTVVTLVIFGFMRRVGQAMFGIPHVSLRMDIISANVEEPAQRIEYICAWEVPLAIGRVLTLLLVGGLYAAFEDKAFALRLALLILCCSRLLSYLLVAQTSQLRAEKQAGVSAPHPPTAVDSG